MTSGAVDLRSAVAQREADLVALRRHLHRHPELAFQEHETARLIRERLAQAGLEVRSCTETGTLGVLRGARPGRTIMVRADIDALPIHEANDVPYRSTRDGTMHACGHDGHTAIALTVAEVLARSRDELAGNVVFCFQPAEEVMGGALPMIEAGAMDDPRVDAVIGLHLWNTTPAGKLGVRAGPMFASADQLRLVVTGYPGHGAIPHLAVDAIVLAHEVIGALQTLISRETDPFQSAVLSIGTIRGGTAFNVIADRVEMTGTLRTYDQQVREQLLRRIDEVMRGVTTALRGGYEFEVVAGCPPTINDPGMAELVREVGREVLGPKNVYETQPTTASDDMAYFLERAPGCYFFLGSGDRAKGSGSPHHTDTFDLDESCLVPAAAVLTAAVRRYLGTGREQALPHPAGRRLD